MNQNSQYKPWWRAIRVAAYVVTFLTLTSFAALAAPGTKIQFGDIPDGICAGDLSDLQVRIKFPQDAVKPVNELALIGEGGQIVGQVTAPTLARRNDSWYYYTFYNIDLSAFEIDGDGMVEIVAMASLAGEDIISDTKDIFIGPPDVPYWPVPFQGATLSTPPTVLDWADPLGAKYYNVYLDGVLVASHLTESQWTVTVGCGPGAHTWSVKAINDCGTTAGPVWRFVVQACTSPGVPFGPSPANNAVLIASPTILNWADVAGATSYDVLLDGAVVASGLTVSQWSCNITVGPGLHSWTVVARNNCGSTTGPVWHFTVGNCAAPAAPSAPNPANGTILANAPAFLDWADCARCTAYDVYLNGDLVAQGLTESKWYVDIVIPSRTNIWYVVARNDCGQTRGPNWRFVLQGCQAPAAPTSPNPANGAVLANPPVVLDWADCSRATSYDVYLNGVQVAFDLYESQWLVDVTLSNGTNIWYIVARNDCGETRGPNWRFVLQGCVAPATPATPNPASGATVTTAPIFLDWADTARANSYDVYLNGLLVASDLYESQWLVDVTLPNGTNIWYVVARNDCGQTRGPNWRFVFQGCVAPAAPATPNPVNAAILTAPPTLLNWGDSSRATSYDVYLNEVLVATDLTESLWYVSVKITTGTNIWYVVARNECGETRGPNWRFVLQGCLQPGTPATPNPANGTVLNTEPVLLNWADTPRALSYDVYLNGTIVAVDLLDSEWYVDTFIPDGTNVWYVVARNDCGQTRGPNWRFVLQACQAPGIPSGPSPINGATLTVSPTVLNWADTPRATSYDVILDGETVATTLPVSQWSCGPMIEPGHHTWQVVAHNDCGETSGPVWSFTVNCARPAAPTTPNPISGAVLSAAPSKLDWADALRAASYDLVVDGQLIASGLTTSESACGTLGNGLHTWYVIARNGCGATTGAVWRFTISCSAPAVPTTPSPINGARLLSAPVKLNWANSLRATSYDVYVDNVLVASDLSLSEWWVDRAITRRTHTWYVVAKNSCGSARSITWSFTVGSGPNDNDDDEEEHEE